VCWEVKDNLLESHSRIFLTIIDNDFLTWLLSFAYLHISTLGLFSICYH
jgi:hypothetical protein